MIEGYLVSARNIRADFEKIEGRRHESRQQTSQRQALIWLNDACY